VKRGQNISPLDKVFFRGKQDIKEKTLVVKTRRCPLNGKNTVRTRPNLATK
jgi:hypothetical protein